MKFTLNGALTIGTLDGANAEIREEVGKENFFLFGLSATEIMRMQDEYCPRRYLEQDPELRQALEQLSGGYFSAGDRELFQPIVQSLLDRDRFFVLADYASYVKCQESAGRTYSDQDRWTRMTILNIARSGKFSSDRAIREYAENIWGISPVKIG